MNIPSRVSAHWTEEQILEHLYSGDALHGHPLSCLNCSRRISAVQEHRQQIESLAGGRVEVSQEFLNAQRRRIYERLSAEPTSGFSRWSLRRWVSAGAAALVLGSVLFVEHQSKTETATGVNRPFISDSQLASEVGEIADSSEPGPTAPLQALFAE